MDTVQTANTFAPIDYVSIAPQDVRQKTADALAARHVEPILVESKEEALAKIKELVPQGASVMNGSSRTLEEIGFVEYLKSGTHGWNNLHEGILAEKDPAKQSALRKQATLSEYYLGSVHALAQSGEFVIGSNTGSQLPHIVFSSKNLIFVVGAQKIVPTLADAVNRLQTHVIPLEDENMHQKYGMGTELNKMVTFFAENPKMGRKVRMILVNEKLGF